MAYKSVKLIKGSAVPSIKVDSSAPIFLPENEHLLEMLKHARVVLHSDGQLAIAQHYAVPNGFGRSIRALTLGLQWKNARRIAGNVDQFAPKMFALPQDGSALIKRMAAKKKTK